MYKYKNSRHQFDKEEILDYVSQEDIYQMVLDYSPKEHIYVKSPFREDRFPGCYFEWYNGILYFKDWGRTSRHKDCFNAVQSLLGLSFYETLVHITKHFKLDIQTDRALIKRKEKQLKKVKFQPDKSRSDITFKGRVFDNKQDRQFWSKYEITKRNLYEDNVFPIVWYRVYSKRLSSYIVIRPLTRTYLIYNENNKRKFYTPDATGRGKWITNCSENEVGNLSNLRAYGHTLVITKSYKDCRVLRNQGLDSIWFQNEGMFPSNDILLSLSERFRDIVILFDNDEAGKKASIELKDIFNGIYHELIARSVWMPEEGKDPSDYIHIRGGKILREFLTLNRVLSDKPF